MHVYFSGIGGTAIGPLALIAKQAGYEVSGSDSKDSQYIGYLRSKGLGDIQIGQTGEQISRVHANNPIDRFVYTSALPLTNEELVFCQENNIKTSKRDDLLNKIIADKGLKLIAISGTHGKTTTTAMVIWLFKSLNLPVSYSVGAKLNFGDMGEFDPASEYFIYEADEYDYNFLAFMPELSLISGLDWDHPDIYPTRESYLEAFKKFLAQSQYSFLWQDDAGKLGLSAIDSIVILDEKDPHIDQQLHLAGRVNRLNAWLVANSMQKTLNKPVAELLEVLDKFPGLSRRFEQIAPNLYSDYAHTPPKIRGALQMASEVARSASLGQAGKNVVVVYEGIHNLRQHFIKVELANLFDDVKQLYIVPTYLGREDKSLQLLTTTDLLNLLSNNSKEHAQTAELNQELVENIKHHITQGDLVIGFSAGSHESLDEWLRQEFHA